MDTSIGAAIWKVVVSGLVVGVLAAIGAWIGQAEKLNPMYAVIVVALLKVVQKAISEMYSGSVLLNTKEG